MIDPHDYKRWLRDRQRYPLFADDPSVVPLPRTAEEAEQRRQQYRSEIESRLRDMRVTAFMRAAYYLKVARRARVPGCDIWAALRTWRVYGLGWEYAADALHCLLRHHGIDVPIPQWEANNVATRHYV